MPGIDPRIICHKLSIKTNAKPVKQKLRRMKRNRVGPSTMKLTTYLQDGFIRETYPDWLSNSILVKKKNGKWRSASTSLTSMKLSQRITRLSEDRPMGHEFLSFMDAYSGYNQIKMHRPDVDKTAFTTDRGIYCYKRMPFELKNIGATFSA